MDYINYEDFRAASDVIFWWGKNSDNRHISELSNQFSCLVWSFVDGNSLISTDNFLKEYKRTIWGKEKVCDSIMLINSEESYLAILNHYTYLDFDNINKYPKKSFELIINLPLFNFSIMWDIILYFDREWKKKGDLNIRNKISYSSSIDILEEYKKEVERLENCIQASFGKDDS